MNYSRASFARELVKNYSGGSRSATYNYDTEGLMEKAVQHAADVHGLSVDVEGVAEALLRTQMGTLQINPPQAIEYFTDKLHDLYKNNPPPQKEASVSDKQYTEEEFQVIVKAALAKFAGLSGSALCEDGKRQAELALRSALGVPEAVKLVGVTFSVAIRLEGGIKREIVDELWIENVQSAQECVDLDKMGDGIKKTFNKYALAEIKRALEGRRRGEW